MKNNRIILLILSISLMFSQGFSQAQDPDLKIVHINGRLFNAADSSVVVGSIIYQKLPYYDDIGRVTTNSDGSFSIPLMEDEEYVFTVEKDGFLKHESSIKASSSKYDIFLNKSKHVELINLDNLIFARGSDKITPSSHEELDGLAKWMHENPSVVIQLEGHTDFAGNPDANMKLSEARILAVENYLEKKGVKTKRILTKAFGGTKPLTTERTPKARIKNRRVEVRVISR